MATFLLLSDIHGCDDDPSSARSPSYVSSQNATAYARTDPFADLKRVCREEGINPDFILCAGDITNRSEPSAFSYVWNALNDLAHSLNSKLVATVGNHDIDSRHQSNKFDPRGYAMSLSPKIPTDQRDKYLEYWAENFTLVTTTDCNLVVLNTAAYHGGGEDAKSELEHGRISEATLNRLSTTIAAAPNRASNILLCHHHPIGAEAGDKFLLGATRGGDELIKVLNNSAHAWIVVHGHKHVPELFYAQGGTNAPVVLSCASFSAQVNADSQNKNPNQVHILSTDNVAASTLGLVSAGQVKSWTWLPGVGWARAHGSQGLPHLSGYGYRGSTNTLAVKAKTWLSNQPTGHAKWQLLLDEVPEILCLLPSDFDHFKKDLQSLGLQVLKDDDNQPAQIGLKQ